MGFGSAPASLEQLPGTRWSRYALPLEYPPSRDLSSRWGYSRPPIEPLYSWLMAHADQYRAVLSDMRLFGRELRDIPQTIDHAKLPQPAWLGGAINPIDTLALYTFMRRQPAATYLEIGSGMTTCFAHRARSPQTKIISVDPEPRAEVDAICDQVIRAGLETCDLSIFDRLASGDIVFMDGSHRCFMNSDVTVFFIDVLPRLKPGVIVHIHDIALPYDYDPYFKNWYWNEQYLLAVYMTAARERIEPLFPGALISREAIFKDDLAAPFVQTAFDVTWGGSGSMWFTHRA